MLLGNVTVQKEWGERDRSCAVGEREAKRGEVNREITLKVSMVSQILRLFFILYKAYLFNIL